MKKLVIAALSMGMCFVLFSHAPSEQLEETAVLVHEKSASHFPENNIIASKSSARELASLFGTYFLFAFIANFIDRNVYYGTRVADDLDSQTRYYLPFASSFVFFKLIPEKNESFIKNITKALGIASGFSLACIIVKYPYIPNL